MQTGGFYELCHHTHLHPNNPPQAHSQIGPSKMYPQIISPPPHNSLSSLHSQKPFSVTIKPVHSLKFVSQNFPTESTSPATTSSEEDINP